MNCNSKIQTESSFETPSYHKSKKEKQVNIQKVQIQEKKIVLGIPAWQIEKQQQQQQADAYQSFLEKDKKEREEKHRQWEEKQNQKKEKEDKRVESYDSAFPALPGSNSQEPTREQKAAIMQGLAKKHYEKVQKEKEENQKAYEERKARRVAAYYRKEGQHIAKMEEILGSRWFTSVSNMQFDCDKAISMRDDENEVNEERAWQQEQEDERRDKEFKEQCKEKDRIHEETIKGLNDKGDKAGLKQYLHERENDEYIDDSDYFWNCAQYTYRHIEDQKIKEERIKKFEAWQKTPEAQLWNWEDMKKLIYV